MHVLLSLKADLMKQNQTLTLDTNIKHGLHKFTVAWLVTWPFNESEAAADAFLIISYDILNIFRLQVTSTGWFDL